MAEITGLSANQSLGPHRAAGPLQPSDPRLWKAAKDFEAVLLAQFVKAMRSSSLRNELFQESAGRQTYDAMFSEAVARQMAENGALGLHRLIYRDMGGEYSAAQRTAPQAGPNQRTEFPVSNDNGPEKNDEP